MDFTPSSQLGFSVFPSTSLKSINEQGLISQLVWWRQTGQVRWTICPQSPPPEGHWRGGWGCRLHLVPRHPPVCFDLEGVRLDTVYTELYSPTVFYISRYTAARGEVPAAPCKSAIFGNIGKSSGKYRQATVLKTHIKCIWLNSCVSITKRSLQRRFGNPCV